METGPYSTFWRNIMSGMPCSEAIADAFQIGGLALATRELTWQRNS